MLVSILKSFPYSADGISNVTLNEGDEHDIADDLVDGLRASGCVALVTAKPAKSPRSMVKTAASTEGEA